MRIIIRSDSSIMMYDPPYPGESILDLCLEPLGMSITKAAEHLGVSRKHLSAVINGHAPISVDLAIRLAKAFGGSAETWVRMQAAYDVWQAKQKAGSIDVKPVRRVA
jgi:addiction module HigA family antidote